MHPEKSLDRKLRALRASSSSKEFILADAKDADMAWGVPCPGVRWPQHAERPLRLMDEYREQMRAIVRQGLVDILLASVSSMSLLARSEGLFAASSVTPAIRANDTTDIWLPRGGSYHHQPSRPFATCDLDVLSEWRRVAPTCNVDLGLYSITFNNDVARDHESLSAFNEFRARASRSGFRYFLEIFAPNVECGLPPERIPEFVNDMIVRTLAGVPQDRRPQFLKIPYFGPAALAELANFDSTLVIGVLGGASGTTLDAFTLIADAKRYGARVALFGRKIKDAEDPLAFVALLRQVADEQITPIDAVHSYHAELARAGIPAKRRLEHDLQLTAPELSYARH
jgi:hypothetical protein